MLRPLILILIVLASLFWAPLAFFSREAPDVFPEPEVACTPTMVSLPVAEQRQLSSVASLITAIVRENDPEEMIFAGCHVTDEGDLIVVLRPGWPLLLQEDRQAFAEQISLFWQKVRCYGPAPIFFVNEVNTRYGWATNGEVHLNQ